MMYVRALLTVILCCLPVSVWSGDTAQNYIFYPYKTQINIQDDFQSGGITGGTIGQIGMGFSGGTTANIASETNRPGIIRRDTSAVSGTIAATMHYFTSTLFAANLPHDITWITRLNNNDANTTVRIGAANAITSNPPTNGVYFEKLDADTNWFCVTRATTQTRVDSGVAVNTNFTTFKFVRTPTQVEWQINGASVCGQITGTLPSVLYDPFTQITNSAAASKTLDHDYYELNLYGLSR